MAEHTPGPWKIDEDEDLPLAVICDNETGDGICELEGPGSSARTASPQAKANACLIAAAPELLDALEVLYAEVAGLKHFDTTEAMAILDKAAGALAKAR